MERSLAFLVPFLFASLVSFSKANNSNSFSRSVLLMTQLPAETDGSAVPAQTMLGLKEETCALWARGSLFRKPTEIAVQDSSSS